MILVDTNVISEPLRKAPEARVVAWIDAQPLETLYLSAVTVAELRFGVASLPAGKRRNGLHESLETRVLPLFAGRVLAFELASTQNYAQLMTKTRVSGFLIALPPMDTSRQQRLPTGWQWQPAIPQPSRRRECR
jgi:toxin FitB